MSAAPDQSSARHVRIDPLGGVAGDMFISALLDARPDLEEGCLAAMRAVGLPEGWRIARVPHQDHGLTGSRLRVERAPETEQAPDQHFSAIAGLIRAAPLGPAVAQRAVAILDLVARVEARIHGVPLDHVHFHELADWDSIVDVVGAAFLIEALQPCTFSSAPLPVGSGRVMTRHGPLPVPAPATARLLEGLPVHDDGVPGERVTPTGAAILRHLEPGERLPPGSWRAGASGYGFGSRQLEGLANVLRATFYEPAGRDVAAGQVAVVEFEVDDQSPEDLAVGLDRMRDLAGVLDVLQTPVFGKKGRIMVQVQVLARPERLDAVLDQCFAQTTTIGLRHRIEQRRVLDRESVMAGGIEVKVAVRPAGGRSAKASIDAVRDLEDRDARDRRRREAEDGALDRSGRRDGQ